VKRIIDPRFIPFKKIVPIQKSLPICLFLTIISSLSSYAHCRSDTTECSHWLNVKDVKSGVTIGDLDISGNKITIEARINRTQAYDPNFFGGDIVSKHRDPDDVNYLLRPNRTEITTTNGFFATTELCNIDLNKTYHVAMVYNGSTLKFYRNGFLLSEVPCSGDLILNDWSTTIGTTAYLTTIYPSDFLGFIDEVRIWNVARTQNELKQYMDQPLPNPSSQTGLLAYYTFGDLQNKQGNPSWNGTLIGNVSINTTNPACGSFVKDSCNILSTIATADFNIPDTVCVGTSVKITNTSKDASSYYWNFCEADINQTPEAVNLGNIDGMLSWPVFVDIVSQDNRYYGFLINHYPGNLIRLDFGNSMLNTPKATNLGNFGGIIPPGYGSEGIQVVQNEGKWYAIIVGGSPASGYTPRILKIDFGTDLANPSPTATDWGNIGTMLQPIDLYVFKDGSNWYGFTVNAENNTITRFNFTNSFDNTPTADNLGNIGGLSYPTGIYAINDNGNWRVFIVNGGDATRDEAPFSLTRLDFGPSLLNTPTGVSLGNPGNTLHHPRDLTIIKFCSEVVGFAVNAEFGYNDIVKLNFNNDLNSIPTASSLGDIGNPKFPHSISKLFRVGADLYSFITNVENNTITRLKFAGCNNASIQNSSAFNPPQIKYNTAGTYNVHLMVDEGLPSQATICKSIVVMPVPIKTPLLDTGFCKGDSILLKTSFPEKTYTWNNGTRDSAIPVHANGMYWVESKYYGCTVRDSINVTQHALPIVNLGNDTSYCGLDSLLLNAGNTGATYQWQDGSTKQTYSVKSAGTYSVLVRDQNDCKSKDTIQVTTFGLASLKVSVDTTICSGYNISLHASGADHYQWSPISTLNIDSISDPVASPTTSTTYYVAGTNKSGCSGIDSVVVKVLPQPTIKIMSDTSICAGSSIVLRTSSSDIITFSWSPNSTLSNSTGSNPIATPTITTNYTVTAGNGFCFVHDSITIDLLEPPLVAISKDTTICGSAQAQLYAAGGVSYIWNPDTGLSSPNIPDPVASPTTTTKYTVHVTGTTTCVATDSVVVSVKSKPAFAVSPQNPEVCLGDSLLLTASGGDTYYWYPTDLVSSSTTPSTWIRPVAPTTYKAVITNIACKVVDSILSSVNIKPKPIIILSKSNDVDCVLGLAKLTATGGVQYTWSPASSLNYSHIANPAATPAETTTYHVFAKGLDGCVTEDSIQVKVLIGEAANGYLMASAFTPNSDGINDCFGIKTWGYVTDVDFSVYNRWGNVVFHTNNSTTCWDGTYKGLPQPSGAYVYQARVKTICGNVFRKGTVVLVR
jgi:gliding motility-associated-like protein